MKSNGKNWRKPSWRWPLLLALISLCVFVTAEKLNFYKTDSLAAVVCTKDLLLGKPDGLKLLTQHGSAIAAEARAYALPPELLAAIIYSHQNEQTAFRQFTDCAGSAFGGDLSLGLAQIRISTAVSNDRLEFASLAPATFTNYRNLLLDPEWNIKYQANELRLLLERKNRYPGITAEELIHDPFIMTLLMSEYRAGRQQAASSDSRLSGNAFWDLRHMLGDGVFMFDRENADTLQIQNAIRAYLGQIYCESGIFNEGACVDWQEAVLRNAGAIY